MQATGRAAFRPILGVALALAGAVAIASQEPDPVALAAGTDRVALAGHVAVLRDDAGLWTLDDVRSPDIAQRFTPDARERLNYSFTAAPHWYRVELSNPGGPSEWVLDLYYPVLDYVDFHIVRATGTTTVLTGDLRPPSPGQLDVRAFAVPLPMAAGESVTVYVRVQTAGQHLVPLALWSSAGYIGHVAMGNARDGAYIGIVLVMSLYNLVIYLWLRDRAYLWYFAYLFAGAGFGLVIGGYARQYGNPLFDDAPRWLGNAYPVFQSVCSLFLLLFSMEFLQTREHAPRLHRLTVATTAVAGVLVATSLLLSYGAANRLNSYFTPVSALLLIGASLYLSLRGVRAARFFLGAWALLLALFIWTALAGFGLVASTFWTTQGLGLGVCIMAVLLSAALADRVLQERKEKYVAAEATRRLKAFLPQNVAELVGAGDRSLLDPKRRAVTVCVIDLRGFTPFSERAQPEDVMAVLKTFYDTMGRIVERHGGTVEHFAGDSMLIFFNAPLEMAEPEQQAVQTALEMRAAFEPLRSRSAQLGYELGLGIGIAQGDATIGAIGFAGRSQYAAIGPVTNLASRLCSLARHGEILTTEGVRAAIEGIMETEPMGEQSIKGFGKPLPVVRVLNAKAGPAAMGGTQPASNAFT